MASRNPPSSHLSWKELACKDGTPYPERFVKDGRVYRLALMFETIRHMCGNQPIVINSAYRSPEWNKKIGGARNSQHVLGQALDIQPPKGMTVTHFYKLIHMNRFQLGINGLGKYPTFVHCDIRETSNDKLIAWNGNGLKDSRTRHKRLR